MNPILCLMLVLSSITTAATADSAAGNSSERGDAPSSQVLVKGKLGTITYTYPNGSVEISFASGGPSQKFAKNQFQSLPKTEWQVGELVQFNGRNATILNLGFEVGSNVVLQYADGTVVNATTLGDLKKACTTTRNGTLAILDGETAVTILDESCDGSRATIAYHNGLQDNVETVRLVDPVKQQLGGQ